MAKKRWKRKTLDDKKLNPPKSKNASAFPKALEQTKLSVLERLILACPDGSR